MSIEMVCPAFLLIPLSYRKVTHNYQLTSVAHIVHLLYIVEVGLQLLTSHYYLIVIAKDEALVSFKSCKDRLRIFQFKAEIPENIHCIILSYPAVPVMYHSFSHIIHICKWSLIKFYSICMSKMKIGRIKYHTISPISGYRLPPASCHYKTIF